MNAIAEHLDAPTLEGIKKLQEEMAKLPQLEVETRHYFADGTYIRELILPAGCALVGKVHKREHIFILLKGDMSIVCDGQRSRIKAPNIFVSKPMVKRAGYAHEDSICVTVHRTDSRDLDEIERETIEEDVTALFDARNKLKQPLVEETS